VLRGFEQGLIRSDTSATDTFWGGEEKEQTLNQTADNEQSFDTSKLIQLMPLQPYLSVLELKQVLIELLERSN